MSLPAPNRRLDLIIRHPVFTGVAWGMATVILISLFEMATGQLNLTLPEGIRRLAVRLLIFALAGPAWGYAVRWYILRKRNHAR